MKIVKKTDRPGENTGGTKFLKITGAKFADAFDSSDTNSFIRYIVDTYGLRCVKMDELFGSAIVDGDLYICVTDGQDIIVNDESVYPEEALERYDIEDLQNYVVDATEEDIRWYITDSEIDFDEDIDRIAENMLKSGVRLSRLVEDYTEIWDVD